MIKPTFIQLLSIVTVALVIGTFVGVNQSLLNLSVIITETRDTHSEQTTQVLDSQQQQVMILDKTTKLESEITGLKTEIVTLKAEIVDLKDQLVKSKVIIAEQAENITQAAK